MNDHPRRKTFKDAIDRIEHLAEQKKFKKASVFIQPPVDGVQSEEDSGNEDFG